jgi:hypothetical protein
VEVNEFCIVSAGTDKRPLRKHIVRPNPEQDRLQTDDEGKVNWKHWGPYLSERAWGTVREDYSPDGSAWEYFPHDHARSRAYRWNEDGLAGICDDHQYLCFALALWNGRDPILKERLFGLTGNQGNHGEDVKEVYFYLDSTPTHSYTKMLYKYPQAAYPYQPLIDENHQRGFLQPEYELLDTGVFDENRYFDVFIEYAKTDPDDLLIRINVANRGDHPAEITLLPTLWFRNTWSWGYESGPMNDVWEKPELRYDKGMILAQHPILGTYSFYADGIEEASNFLFTENETNFERLFSSPNASPYVKDAFHRFIVDGDQHAVNPDLIGTKAAVVYRLQIEPGETQVVRLRLAAASHQASHQASFNGFENLFKQRIEEANTFYDLIHAEQLTDEERSIQRQAFAGMLWSKQLYYYDVRQWLHGDPIARPPGERKQGRNHTWEHLNNFDILSMPDKWEYPWYAAWDLAFHTLPLALVDAEFAKQQLILLTREWYLHSNGQVPAYEWAFSDVNPPVIAWAAWHIYDFDGRKDKTFLKRIFNKMLLNFTWWVNRKDVEERSIFQGGFLGMDNISIFDRSSDLPEGGHINQSDGTAWMGFYCMRMMNIAIELAKDDPAYEDMAIKFYEHFLQIAAAMSGFAREDHGLWDEDDGFFYDQLSLPEHQPITLKVRSMVGLIALTAVETVGQPTLDALPEFANSLKWLSNHRSELTGNMMDTQVEGYGSAHIFSIPTEERLRRVLTYLLNEDEFLAPYGIRSLSKFHEQHPYQIDLDGRHFTVRYEPAEAQSGLFGGNSNWRGPIWFPINFLLIEALRIYYRYFGDDFKIECPTGSGNEITLEQVADDLCRRLSSLFRRDAQGNRPIDGSITRFRDDPHWRDYMLFHEYFHGDNGTGLGASHQTGWTGLVIHLLQQVGKSATETTP